MCPTDSWVLHFSESVCWNNIISRDNIIHLQMRTTDKCDGSEIVQNDEHKCRWNVSLHTALTVLCSLLVASFIPPLQQWFLGTLRIKVGSKHLVFCFLRNLQKLELSSSSHAFVCLGEVSLKGLWEPGKLSNIILSSSGPGPRSGLGEKSKNRTWTIH